MTDAARPQTFATEADFESVDLEGPIAGNLGADVIDFMASFAQAASDARAEGQDAAARAYALTAEICRFHLRPEVVSDPYGPMMSGEGKRTAIPSDFAGEQTAVIARLAPSISCAPLRARFAEVAWLNSRRDRASANLAMEAYCDTAAGLQVGTLTSRFQKAAAVPHELITSLKRALAISSAVNKRGVLDARPQALVCEARERARSAQEAGAYLALSKLAVRYGVTTPIDLAREVRDFALSPPKDGDPVTLKELFNLSADAFEDAGDHEKARDARILAAEALVQMADQMGGSPMASSSWLTDAIAAYRRIKGTKARRGELEARLREVQGDAFEEMGVIQSDPIDLTELAESRIELFATLTLSEALGQLASLARSTPIEDLKSQAMRGVEESPLSAMFAASMIDDEGKVIAENPGIGTDQVPSDEWFMHQFARSESFRRLVFVNGEFEPVRRVLLSRLDIGERHFAPIARNSPFVPLGHEEIFARGFSALVHGQMPEAVYLLLPQLENSLRGVLKATGQDASILKADMIQEDANLSAILDRHRPDVDRIFGLDLALEIDLLFNHRAGPSLRHALAHGKLATGACYGADCRYACWLMFRLTCLPLFAHWRQVSALIDPVA